MEKRGSRAKISARTGLGKGVTDVCGPNRRYAAATMASPANIMPHVQLAEWHLYHVAAEATEDHKGKPVYRTHIVLRRR